MENYLKRYSSSDALCMQSSIHVLIRIFLVLAILFNMALFTWSNNIHIASMRGTLSVHGKEEDLGEIFSFDLRGTVQDMWDAEVYALAVLVSFFSGAWPYVKLSSMLMSFVLPKTLFSYYIRDKVLIWLDILGKWSLLDTYFMIMMMVAFQFDLFVAREVEIYVYVDPEWGFYSFLLATMLNLLLGHIVLYYHRQVTDKENNIPSISKIIAGNSLQREAILSHTFHVTMDIPMTDLSSEPLLHEIRATDSNRRGDNGKGVWRVCKVRVTKFGNCFVVVFMLSCVLAILFGTFRETFSFKFKGLTGFLLGDDATQSFSVVSLGTSLPAASGTPNDPGIRWMEASQFLFALGMPLAFLLSIFFLWIMPLTLQEARIAIQVAEIINAWNALDVFVISLVAALLEIQQFAAFIIGDSCDGLNAILEEYMDGPLDGDDKCFDVIATLKTDAWLLYFSAGFLSVVGVAVMLVCEAAFRERRCLCITISKEGMVGHSEEHQLVSCDAGVEVNEPPFGSRIICRVIKCLWKISFLTVS